LNPAGFGGLDRNYEPENPQGASGKFKARQNNNAISKPTAAANESEKSSRNAKEGAIKYDQSM
jgi:hypothetical protein